MTGQRKCKVDGCEKIANTKGLCTTHYGHFLRFGSIGRKIKRTECGTITASIREQIKELLCTTRLSYSEIGARFGISRGPIDKIVREYNVRRPDIRKGRHSKEHPCPSCGKSVLAFDSHKLRGRQKFCSKTCYATWQKSEANRGENNPNWLDGGKHESEMNRRRKTPEWRQWRDAVFKRDSYVCQICGTRGGKLHPHHILVKVAYPQYIFDYRNGITLCEKCHRLPGIHNHEKGWAFLIKHLREASYMHL